MGWAIAGNGPIRVTSGAGAEKRLSVRVPRWKPTKKFVAWVKDHYSVNGLAKSIAVERWTIYGWLRGECAPREDNARAIMLLSQYSPGPDGALTFDDIYGTPGEA